MTGRIVNSSNDNRIAIVGKIKIGEKAVINGKEIPKSLDYFKATGNYSTLFHQTFGEKPRELKIIFVSDNIEDVCNERFEFRKGKKLYATGNGEVYRIYSEKTSSYETYTKTDRPNIEDEINKKYGTEKSKLLTLRFLLPEIKGLFGLWQFDTKSEHSTSQIISMFDIIKDQAGTIVQVPFDLSVEKVTSQKPDSKHSFPIVKMVCNLSQGSLETVRGFFETGNRIPGMLTEDKIKLIGGGNGNK